MNITLITFLAIVALIAVMMTLFCLATTRRGKASPVLRKLYLTPLLMQRLLGRFPQRAFHAPVQFANIGEGTHDQGRKSYLPDAGTSGRYLLYKRGSDADHCAICGAADDPLGPSDDQADANNLDVPITINLLGAVKGTVRVITDGTVADGNYVKCGASGKVTVAATGDLSFGRAVIPTDSSSANGDPIAIIPMAPAKYAF